MQEKKQHKKHIIKHIFKKSHTHIYIIYTQKRPRASLRTTSKLTNLKHKTTKNYKVTYIYA